MFIDQSNSAYSQTAASLTVSMSVRDNYNLKSHKYVYITTYQPDTKSNHKSNLNLNPTTKQHAIVNSQLNISQSINQNYYIVPKSWPESWPT